MKKIPFLLILMLSIRAVSPVLPSPGPIPSPSPGLVLTGPSTPRAQMGRSSSDPSTVQHEFGSNLNSVLGSPSVSNVRYIQLQNITDDLNAMKVSFSIEQDVQNGQIKSINNNLSKMRNSLSRELKARKAQNQRIETINEKLKGLQPNFNETKQSLREMREDIKNETIDFFNTEQDRIQKNLSIQLNRIKSEFLNKLRDQEQIATGLQTRVIDESKRFQNKLKDIEKKFKQISKQDQDIKNMKPKIEELVKENKLFASQKIKQDKNTKELFEANEIFAQQRMQDQKQIENLFQHVKKIQKDSCLLLVAYVVLGFCCLIYLCFK
jgi:chromosome segregation ATPase